MKVTSVDENKFVVSYNPKKERMRPRRTCPFCGSKALSFSHDNYRCNKCGKEYEVRENGLTYIERVIRNLT